MSELNDAVVITRLQTKAQVASNMITSLRKQLSQLKQQAIASETDRLSQENEELRESVKRLQLKLTNTQIQNGVTLYPSPSDVIPPQVVTSLGKTMESCVSNGPVTTPTTHVTPSLNNAPSPQTENKTQPVTPDKTKAKKETKKPTESKKGPSGEVKMDVSRLDFRIGKIVSVKRHPDAEGLYVEEIDVGEEKNRTVISGLVKHVTMEEMQDKLLVVICNLKPAKMRGIVSEAMVMCASSPDKVEIINPPEGSIPGDRVSFEGYSGTPDTQLNPKKKVFETLQPDLNTDSSRVATYKGVPFVVEGKGACIAPTMANAAIK